MNDEIANVFGLNPAQQRFVRDAIPGSDEKGYSQALLGVDSEWRGMEVRALPQETAVIENQGTQNTIASTDAMQSRSVATDDD